MNKLNNNNYIYALSSMAVKNTNQIAPQIAPNLLAVMDNNNDPMAVALAEVMRYMANHYIGSNENELEIRGNRFKYTKTSTGASLESITGNVKFTIDVDLKTDSLLINSYYPETIRNYDTGSKLECIFSLKGLSVNKSNIESVMQGLKEQRTADLRSATKAVKVDNQEIYKAADYRLQSMQEEFQCLTPESTVIQNNKLLVAKGQYISIEDIMQKIYNANQSKAGYIDLQGKKYHLNHSFGVTYDSDNPNHFTLESDSRNAKITVEETKDQVNVVASYPKAPGKYNQADVINVEGSFTPNNKPVEVAPVSLNSSFSKKTSGKSQSTGKVSKSLNISLVEGSFTPNNKPVEVAPVSLNGSFSKKTSGKSQSTGKVSKSLNISSGVAPQMINHKLMKNSPIALNSIPTVDIKKIQTSKPSFAFINDRGGTETVYISSIIKEIASIRQTEENPSKDKAYNISSFNCKLVKNQRQYKLTAKNGTSRITFELGGDGVNDLVVKCYYPRIRGNYDDKYSTTHKFSLKKLGLPFVYNVGSAIDKVAKLHETKSAVKTRVGFSK